MAKHRTSMKGMGADAFFHPPAATELPASQDTGKPVDQQASMPVSQQTGNQEVPLVKATFYLSPDDVMKLEQVRLARKKKGIKIDKSALVREAIGLLQE